MRARRILQLAGVFAALVGLLLARLAQLQVSEHEDWQREAWRSRLSGTRIPYRRGSLLDRRGEVLAEDRKAYDLAWRYRDFRRGHPAAQLLEACALLGVPLDGLAESFARAESYAAYWLACRPQDLAALPAREREDLGFYLRRLAGVRAEESEAFRRWSGVREGPPLGDAFSWAAERHGESLRRARADWARLAAALGENGDALLRRLEGERRELEGHARFRALRKAAARASGLDVRGMLNVIQPAGDAAAPPQLLALARRWSWTGDPLALERLLREREPESGVAATLALVARAAPEDAAGLVRSERFAVHADRELTLRRDLAFTVVDLLVQEAAGFPGFSVREVARRVYPAAVSPQLVGAVGVPDEAQLRLLAEQRDEYGELARVFERNPDQEARYRALQRLLAAEAYYPGELTGKKGAELAFEPRLRGRSGELRVLRGAEEDARPAEVEFMPASEGESIRLALDAAWQRAAEDAIREAYAEVAAMDGLPPDLRSALRAPRCGFALLDLRDGGTPVLATLPTYTAEEFRAEYGRLLADPARPLRHRALGEGYAGATTPYPGSTFKPLVAAAALACDPGAARRRVVCDGTWRPRQGLAAGQRPLDCDERRAHGEVDMEEALMRSCNVYFYTLAEELGYPALHDFAAALGFGASTGLEVGREGKLLWSAESVRDPFTLARTGIGQVTVEAPPLQMARLYGWLATGTLWRPSLEAGGGAPLPDAPALAPAARALIVKALRRVVEDPRGTAHDPRWPLWEFRVAGKTGTAQSGAGAPVHAWFTGWFPHDRPRWAFAILCENAGVHGGDLAAVVLYRFLQRCGGELLEERP